MLVVRPVDFADLDAITHLYLSAGATTFSMPTSREHLASLIFSTQKSLTETTLEPAGETYFFILEDTVKKQLIGIAGIIAGVGMSSSFYNYRMDSVVYASEKLHTYTRLPALKLCSDYTGFNCLCGFYILPEAESEDTFNLLTQARLLFIAEHQERFAERTMVELQGITDNKGKSPFWTSLGEHFVKVKMNHINALTSIHRKELIADLMPDHPIYLHLLPHNARSVIGEVRPDRIHFVDLLEWEGFSYEGYIDIFDAGPNLEAKTKQLRTVANSYKAKTTIATYDSGCKHIVANTETTHFRCGAVNIDPNLNQLSSLSAEYLHLHSDNNYVRYAHTY